MSGPALNLAPAANPPLALVADRKPPPFSLIEPLPAGLTAYPTLEALAERCAQLLAGRAAQFTLATGAYPPFAAVALVTVWAAPREWLAAAALGGADAQVDLTRLRAAIDDHKNNTQGSC